MNQSIASRSSGFIKSRGMKFPKEQGVVRGRLRGDLRKETYELKEVNAVLRVVRSEDTVLELGGGIGYISTLIAMKCRAKHVHVFEANSMLADYIRATHAANGVNNTSVRHAILGKRKGSVDFHVRKNILSSSMDEIEGSQVVRTEKVDVLNANAEIQSIAPDVLVCDIEGAEATLLPDMNLSGLRAAIVELHPQWIGPEGVNSVFKAFMNAGLAYYPRFSTQKVVTFRKNWPIK